MTIDINLDELEATARAASQGFWEAEQSDETIELNKGTALTKWNDDKTVGTPAWTWRSTDRLMEIDIEDLEEDEIDDIAANVDHIAAARPEVVLALIERVRAAEAAAARMQKSFDVVARMANWWEPAADKVLERIHTDTTEDVMLYHDAVSVLASGRSVFEIAKMHSGGESQADRLEYTIVAESSNGALSQLADYTTVVREHLVADLEQYRAEEAQAKGSPERIFIAERPIPKWVRS